MLNLYTYITVGMFGGFALLELLLRGRDFPEVTRWRLKGAAFLLLYLALATYAPPFWDAWLGQYSLFDASGLPLWVQIVAGFLIVELGVYAWHRTMHNTPFLWRWLHQMHHSAERVDVWGAFYFHPFDVIGFALVGSLCLVGGFGVSVDAAIIVNLAAVFCSLFQHTNINTPRWLGYLITRPESHSLHHERDVHARNYGDIPLYDMIFGTFVNPARFEGQAGFHEGGSKRVGEMLVGRLVS